jgi:hypothetical protein
VGSRRRAASQAIDLPSNGGVNLVRLVPVYRPRQKTGNVPADVELRGAALLALSRALACTNIVENVMSTVRRVWRNVKRWRSASMALRWTAAAMEEAAKGLRR